MSAQQTTSDPRETDADGTPAEGTHAIPKDDAFHILQNPRRRAVLRYLLEHDDQEQFRMRDVTEEVAAWEHETTVRQLSSDERQRVYIALYQSHLPKLDDHGVIDYDRNRGTVEPTPLLAVFDSYLADGLHADDDVLTAADDDRSGGGLSASVSAFFDR